MIKVSVSTAAGQAKYELSSDIDVDDNVLMQDGAIKVISDDGATQDWFGPGFWHHVHAVDDGEDS